MQTASQSPIGIPVNSQQDKFAGANVKVFGGRRKYWQFASNAGKGLAIAASLLLVTIPAAIQYLPSINTNDYYTLSAAKSDSDPAGKLRVVFAKNLTDKDIDAMLSQIGGVRIGEANSVGAYTVKITAGKQDTDMAGALALLRSRQDVILAEPILQP